MPLNPPKNPSEIITALGAIVGDKHLATADADKEKYLTDWRGVYRGEAIAVVKPATTDEVSRILKLAEAENIAIIPQGGNTGLCGGATPDTGARNVILSTENLNKIREIDRESQTITAEAGCVLDTIKTAAEEHGLFFPLNLGARGSCQIGGNLATNAGGLNVVRYGNARALTLGIEAVLMGGATLPLLSKLKKDNMGYDLKHFFIGAEGTLGVITAATLQLFPKPLNLATAFVGLRDIDAGIALLQNCQKASNQSVSAFELIPKTIIDAVTEFYPDTPQFIAELPRFCALIEMTSTAEDDALENALAQTLADAMAEGLINDATIASNASQRQALWQMRERVPEAEIKAGKAYKSDIALPLKHIAKFYDEAVAMVEAISPEARIFGFGHLGDNNLHFNLCAPRNSTTDFTRFYPEFDAMLMRLMEKYHGTMSAEHGIGQKKRSMLAESKAEAVPVMRAIKTALDPKNLMNPDKII